jgi:hypothetical protein
MPAQVAPGLQEIHINGGTGPVDLAPLAAATRLRVMHLNSGSV